VATDIIVGAVNTIRKLDFMRKVVRSISE